MSSWSKSFVAVDPSSGGFITGGGFHAAYVSTCKYCWLGVYTHQKWVFARRPLGISHQACVDGAR